MRLSRLLSVTTVLTLVVLTRMGFAQRAPGGTYYVSEPTVGPAGDASEGACADEATCDSGAERGICEPCAWKGNNRRGVFPCRCGGGLGEPWTLQESLFGAGPDGCHRYGCLGDLRFGGWLSAGVYGNEHGAAVNGPLGFNDVGDGFTLNQLWLYAEKPVDTGGCGTDWGFRVDYVFGVDGPDTQAFGGHPDRWDNRWDTSRDYGSALPQLYGEIGVNDLSVKLGHFYTIIGWEVVTAPDNFFYSHAYTMYYGEPFTHTGALASYDLTDNVTVHAGWTQGWDTGFDNTFGADTFLGGVGFPVGQRATFTWAVSAGDLGEGIGDIYMNSLVLEWNLTERFTYILQHDLGAIDGAADSEWYGINQYFQYQLNECWAAGMRVEWFRDDDGARISINGPASGDYYELTWGLNWRPHANFTLRPEIRYDWFDGVAAPGDLPFNDGASSDQFAGGFDLIFTY